MRLRTLFIFDRAFGNKRRIVFETTHPPVKPGAILSIKDIKDQALLDPLEDTVDEITSLDTRKNGTAQRVELFYASSSGKHNPTQKICVGTIR
jgi:hypothetical protein